MKHSGFIPEKLYAAHLCVDFSPPPPHHRKIVNIWKPDLGYPQE